MLFVILLPGCSMPGTQASPDIGGAVSEVPAVTYKEWDLGGGLVVSAPTYWGIGYTAPDPACVPYFGSFSGSAPEDNTLLLSIPWIGSPFAAFDLSAQSFDGTLANGTEYASSAAGVLYLDGQIYATHSEGVVAVTALNATTGARVGLEDVPFVSAKGGEIRVTSSFDFDLRVFCAVPVGDPGESGDGDTDDSCVAVQDSPPYKNEDCQELTAEFPDDVKY